MRFTAENVKTSDGKALLTAFTRLDGGKRWIKGNYRGFSAGVECYCALGALHEESPRRHLYAAMGEGGGMSVALFNDAPETTWQDIEKLYERAIEIAEEEGA